MKTIGISVTGLMRTWESCYPNLLKHLIQPNKEFKIYLLGYINGIEDVSKFKKKYKFDELVSSQDETLPDISAQRRRYTDQENTHHPIRAYYQLYDLKKSIDVIKSFEDKKKMKFDYLIRQRTDIDIMRPVKLPTPIEKTMYLPYGHDYEGYNDRFAYGTREDMLVYLNRFDFWMDKSQTCSTHIERNLKRYLNNHNIAVQRLGDFNYSFKRLIDNQEYNVDGYVDGKIITGQIN